jgi:hypothetical protein
LYWVITIDDSVGGDMYWAAGASVIGPLPLKPHWPLKTHMFINAGRLDSYDTSTFLYSLYSLPLRAQQPTHPKHRKIVNRPNDQEPNYALHLGWGRPGVHAQPGADRVEFRGADCCECVGWLKEGTAGWDWDGLFVEGGIYLVVLE